MSKNEEVIIALSANILAVYYFGYVGNMVRRIWLCGISFWLVSLLISTSSLPHV